MPYFGDEIVLQNNALNVGPNNAGLDVGPLGTIKLSGGVQASRVLIMMRVSAVVTGPISGQLEYRDSAGIFNTADVPQTISGISTPGVSKFAVFNLAWNWFLFRVILTAGSGVAEVRAILLP